MVIAAYFLDTSLPGSSLFTCLNLLASTRPDDELVFFVDEQSQKTIPPQANIKLVLVKPAVKNGLMLTYWHRFKLPKQLKKHAADIFISDAGAFCAGASIPQLAWIEDISFIDKKQSNGSPYSSFLRRYFPQFLKNGARLIVPQPFLKTALDKKFPSGVSKISCLPTGLSEDYTPMDEDDRQTFLQILTGGTEYFICEADQYSAAFLTTALKAFSLFKKRQKSSMKLLIVTHGIQADQHVKDLHLYKYRADLVVKPFSNSREHAQLLGAAYAGIYVPGKLDKINNIGLQVLKAGIPLIVSDLPANHELFDDAVLYADPDEKAIADHMMELYKNEEKRKNLVTLGLQHARAYNWEDCVDELWQTILWHASYKAH